MNWCLCIRKIMYSPSGEEGILMIPNGEGMSVRFTLCSMITLHRRYMETPATSLSRQSQKEHYPGTGRSHQPWL